MCGSIFTPELLRRYRKCYGNIWFNVADPIVQAIRKHRMGNSAGVEEAPTSVQSAPVSRTTSRNTQFKDVEMTPRESVNTRSSSNVENKRRGGICLLNCMSVS